MKKIIYIITLMVFVSFNAKAQTNDQPISMKKTLGTYAFSQDGKRLKLSEITSLLQNNTEALKLFSKAKTNNTVAMILGGIGGALIGFPIGSAISGGEANWGLAGIGGALSLIAIPFNNGFNKNAKKAVELFNNGVGGNAYRFNPTYNLNIKANGISLAINF